VLSRLEEKRPNASIAAQIYLLSHNIHAGQLLPEKKRDTNMRRLFLANNPCPSTGNNKGACPGYVVDHIVPIKRGGGDNPYNMQWQSILDAKEKDRWE
jgi:5-methylcytosine-specific restriction endonuclease McrA